MRRAGLSILAAFHLALALGAAVLWARSYHTEDRLFLADVNLTDRAGGRAYSWLGTSRGGRVLLLAHEDYDLNEGKLPVVRWRSRCVGRERAERERGGGGSAFRVIDHGPAGRGIVLPHGLLVAISALVASVISLRTQ